jgi:hypothetical protein
MTMMRSIKREMNGWDLSFTSSRRPKLRTWRRNIKLILKTVVTLQD